MRKPEWVNYSCDMAQIDITNALYGSLSGTPFVLLAQHLSRCQECLMTVAGLSLGCDDTVAQAAPRLWELLSAHLRDSTPRLIRHRGFLFSDEVSSRLR